eukprot:983822_1
MSNGDVLPVSIMGYEETVNENVYLCSQGGWIRGCTKINEFASVFTKIGDIETIGTNVYQCSEKFEWIRGCTKINEFASAFTKIGDIETIGTNVYQCSEKFEWIGYCKGAQINGDKLDLTRMGNIFRVNGLTTVGKQKLIMATNSLSP